MDAEKFLQALTPEETQQLVSVLPTKTLTSEVNRRADEISPVIIDALGTSAVESDNLNSTTNEVFTVAEVKSFTPETKESVAEQLGLALKGYKNTIFCINLSRNLEKRNLEVATERKIADEFDACLLKKD